MKSVFNQKIENGNHLTCKNGLNVSYTQEKKLLKPSEIKKLKKDIESNYSKYMSGIQVNIMNLSKLEEHVFNNIVNYNLSMENAYDEARSAFREN